MKSYFADYGKIILIGGLDSENRDEIIAEIALLAHAKNICFYLDTVTIRQIIDKNIIIRTR